MLVLTDKVKFKKLHPEAILPKRATPYAVGMDLYANEYGVLAPGETVMACTGIAIELPPGFEGQVRPRSGLAAKYGVTVLNSPGTIDPDYRGEIKVILANHGKETFRWAPGERIGQLVIAEVTYMGSEEVQELSPAPTRGDAGFGSTGR